MFFLCAVTSFYSIELLCMKMKENGGKKEAERVF